MQIIVGSTKGACFGVASHAQLNAVFTECQTDTEREFSGPQKAKVYLQDLGADAYSFNPSLRWNHPP